MPTNAADFSDPTSIREPRNVLIFGCGYVGLRVARLARDAGHSVWATTRHRAKAQKLAAAGLHPVIADWSRPGGLSGLPDAIDRVLIAVSYDAGGPADRYESQVLGLGRLIDRLPPAVNLVYISTTGVYHQTDGSWVDESSPTHPRRQGGAVHLQAESRVRRRGGDQPWTILRLAGIYGPGRIPRIDAVASGRPVASPAGGYLNLIHVADAAAATMAAWRRMESRMATGRGRTCRRLFAVADDRPVIRGDFYGELARRVGAPPPTYTDAARDAFLSVRSDSNKRVWNRRMKHQLCPRLAFPTFREGLADAVDAGRPETPPGPGVPRGRVNS